MENKKKTALRDSNLQLFAKKYFANSKKSSTFATDFKREIDGVVAQLVEQRTENPCVTGSIPVNATKKIKGSNNNCFLFSFMLHGR